MKLTRRFFALGVILASLILLVASPAGSAGSKGGYLLYVGTYTVRGSEGIYAFRYDAASGQMTSLGLAAKTSNPSYLAAHPSRRFLYAVNEDDNYHGQASGAVSAFAIDPDSGKLTLLNDVASRGSAPCHLSVDRAGKFVLVANYTGGNIAVFPVLTDGRLGETSAFVQHKGSGPNPQRQEGPHAHWIDLSPDNRFALTADLGLDEVLVYLFDGAKGSLAPNQPPFVKADPGAGPRHVALHPSGKFAYVVNELNSTITSFSYDARTGALRPMQTVSTLPKGFAEENTTAEIVVHSNGKFLYASNRGHDSIAVFAIDPKTGTLTFVEHVPTQGKTPRNFEIDPTGTRLLAANQDSDNIVVFHIDQTTGRLSPTGQQIKLPAPVCIRFVRSQ